MIDNIGVIWVALTIENPVTKSFTVQTRPFYSLRSESLSYHEKTITIPEFIDLISILELVLLYTEPHQWM